jgi:hypothetical protein
MVQIEDKRAAQPLWDLAGADRVTPEVAGTLAQSLTQLYLGNQRYIRGGGQPVLPPEDRKEAVQAARGRADAGPETLRLIGLTVLLAVSPEEAGAAANRIVDDPKAGPGLRRDAFQVLLLSGSRADGRRLAVAALASKEPALRKLAVTFLALGPEQLQSLRHEQWSLRVDNPDLLGGSTYQGGKPIVPEAPKELKPDMFRPLLQDGDPETAAGAGYLAVLLGEPEGLEPLLRYWRGQARTNPALVRLVYRAVAALDDDGKVPVLEEVYRGFGPGDSTLGDFYWTIRVLDGPNALKLRKQIRQEVGMERLR